MTREQLEHLIRAGAEITQDQLVVIGSQSILATAPQAPDELRQSMEADMYPRSDPSRAVLIDGSIGEGSIFQDTFGYYAHGVGPETVKAPEGWQERLIPVSTPGTAGATAWCLHPLDLAVAKLVAGRQKDWDFVVGMLRSRLIEAKQLRGHAEAMQGRPGLDEAVEGCIARASV